MQDGLTPAAKARHPKQPGRALDPAVEKVIKGLEASLDSDHPIVARTRPALLQKLRTVLSASPVSQRIVQHSFDPINVSIELQHLNALVNLLRAAIEEKRVEVRELDLTSGTVVNSLWSIEWGLDRIQAEVDRYMRDGTSEVANG